MRARREYIIHNEYRVILSGLGSGPRRGGPTSQRVDGTRDRLISIVLSRGPFPTKRDRSTTGVEVLRDPNAVLSSLFPVRRVQSSRGDSPGLRPSPSGLRSARGGGSMAQTSPLCLVTDKSRSRSKGKKEVPECPSVFLYLLLLLTMIKNL